MSIHTFPDPTVRPTTPDRPLRLGFLSPHNALDRQTFSGTPFQAARALGQRKDLHLRLIGNHRSPGRLDRILRHKSTEITFDRDDLEDLDTVVGLVATSHLDHLAELRPDLPFLHVSDATPQFLRDTYGWAIPAEADAAEARVAARAAACIYSSDFIARRAPGDLGLAGLVTASLPFGANFNSLPESPCEKGPFDRVELLFVGLDWERKGGDIAIAALDELIVSGRDARLTIVGLCPVRHLGHPAVRNVGFLDKNRPADAKRLSALFAEAHLLLLPSRADCTPMVVAEAMAHGTPVLASDTGGVAQQIGGAGAGLVLPPFSPPEAWAATISGLTTDADAYRLMSDAAFDRAALRLSWSAWAEKIADLARQTVSGSFHPGTLKRTAVGA